MAWAAITQVEDTFRRTVHAEMLDADGWTELLDEAGLGEVVGNAYPLDVSSESKGRAERYGRWALTKTILKMLVSLFRDPTCRGYLKDGAGGLSRDMLKVLGYGVFVGRKPQVP